MEKLNNATINSTDIQVKENLEDHFNLSKVFKILWKKRYLFCIVWLVTIVLSCLWIFPQPRYYDSEVKLAPEGMSDEAGGIASVASSFGFNIGGGATNDAIYPSLYPELFKSPEFIVSLYNIHIKTYDNSYSGTYYTYITEHQNENAIVAGIKSLFNLKDKPNEYTPLDKINFFDLTKNDFELVEKITRSIQCSYDKKNDLITISVQDQDKKVCALMADSISVRLQDFIIDYRTKKVRQDVAYYEHLTDSARIEYEKALGRSTSFDDAHRNVSLQTVVGQGEKLKNDLTTMQTTYNTFKSSLDAAKAKVQERTPSFTTLKSAYIPSKPAGPKRIRFVLGMLIFVTIVLSLVLVKSEMKKLAV